ncbi:hypothetical protein GCM10011416_00560 [Polaribacter pacificus]|uniref:Uncharacterized protein n=2 Tax=Polaribacter pacificus TaxID=1775173 RepID=A0A917HSM2_9FLAO|nr:hypothetical protein GCM10011416_00560 [Polaribacter pacificus]
MQLIMKNKYWFSLILFFIIGLLLIYKDSIYITEKVYIIFKKNDVFYKNENNKDIYYYVKEGRVLELARLKSKNTVAKKLQKIKNLNIITIDSLSKIVPFSEYDTYNWDKNKLDRLKKIRMFIIEVDSLNNKVKIQEVYQPFSESDEPL